ncbi:MAG: CRISPR-associated endonuclease Cas2 [Lewinellaceae bacterium]|nr:CRISPR-associated endonuclease Cas2 [Lewinellaceae bacterium]
MYVIAVYDVAAERTPKMLKLCRRYLHWIQNSVFEGELSELQIKELELDAKKIMDESHDSLILFKSRHFHYMEKQLVGKSLNDTDSFL